MFGWQNRLDRNSLCVNEQFVFWMTINSRQTKKNTSQVSILKLLLLFESDYILNIEYDIIGEFNLYEY